MGWLPVPGASFCSWLNLYMTRQMPCNCSYPMRTDRYEEYSIVQNAPMSLGIRGSWGYVSISFGRALAWHSKLTRFYPAYLHQKHRLLPQKVGVLLTFLGFSWFWVNIKVSRKGHFRPMSRRKDGQDGLHSGKGKRKWEVISYYLLSAKRQIGICRLPGHCEPVLRLVWQSPG